MSAFSVAGVRLLTLDALRDAGDAAGAGGEALEQAAGTVDAAVDRSRATWAGAAADVAHEAVTAHAGSAHRAAARESGLGTCLAEHSARLSAARNAVLAAADAARAQGFSVDEAASTVTAVDGASAADGAAEAQEVIARALRGFASADSAAAAAVDAIIARSSSWADLLAGTFGLLDPAAGATAPPEDGTPAENRAYWQSLTDAQRADLIATHPAAVGALDGIPSDARHRANVAQLDAEQQRLTRDVERYQKEYDSSLSHHLGGAFSSTNERLDRARTRLRDAEAVRTVLAAHPDARLMALDLRSGRHAHAVVAVGNPDTAAHIAVTTPGVDTTVHGSLEGMVDEAARLRSTAGAQAAGSPDAGRDEVAAVAWIGYDAPLAMSDGPLDRLFHHPDETASAAFDTVARDGADSLAPFLAGLDAASELPDPHITALGHSYGSLTTGLALQELAGQDQAAGAVDDTVFLGSPGVEASTPQELGLAPHHAYVLEADGDLVADAASWRAALAPDSILARFGPDPSWCEDFEQLSSDAAIAPDGTPLAGTSGHSDYMRAGPGGMERTTVHNLAAVVSGHTENLVR